MNKATDGTRLSNFCTHKKVLVEQPITTRLFQPFKAQRLAANGKQKKDRNTTSVRGQALQ